ncbi:MAG: SPOR domain-containing protein [Candidatus Zixiibacteriota bacterium]
MYKQAILIILSLLLVAGCAKKKEEAQRLEQELMDQQAAAPDTLMEDTLAAADTIGLAVEEPFFEETSPYAIRETEPPGFVLQVAACPSLEYARYLIDLYQQRGYDPYLTSTFHNGEKYYRVRVGGFDTYQEARALQMEILDKFSASAWIEETQ